MEKIKAKKSLGQNFLKDEFVLNKIADSIDTKENDLIIEIGPGKGALTKYLKEKNSFLISYEIDERMRPILENMTDAKTKIIFKDFLQVDVLEDSKCFPYENIYVIANIPYYITTPIIKKIVDIREVKSMSLLVQKEVAQRFSAHPGSKAYGSITVYLNYFFDVQYIFDVKNTCFDPAPKVDSAVIQFRRLENSRKVQNEDVFFKLVNDAFKMKRKTLKNNLKEYDWEKIYSVLKSHNLSENVRAEELSIDVFIDIADMICKS